MGEHHPHHSRNDAMSRSISQESDEISRSFPRSSAYQDVWIKIAIFRTRIGRKAEPLLLASGMGTSYPSDLYLPDEGKLRCLYYVQADGTIRSAGREKRQL